MKNGFFRKCKAEFAAYAGLLFCIIIFSVFPPLRGETMWSSAKVSTLVSDVIVTAIMAVGSVFVYALGAMDISVGKQVGLYCTIMVALGNTTGSLIPGILLSLLVAVVFGCINASAGELLNLHPIMSSLVIMMMLGGLISIIYTNVGKRSVNLTTIDYSRFKNPIWMVVVLIVITAVIFYLFNYTKLGKNAKAIGANRTAAKQCGISILKYQIASYLIMAFALVIASVFQMGYTGSASDSTGTGFEMNVMLALVLGGMPISGGMRSRVSCAVIGAFTLSLLSVGLPLLGIEPNMVYLIKALIFIAVTLMTLRKPHGILPR
jgi:ribose transport system permease protein